MTDQSTPPELQDPRLRGPEAWLIGAFLVFFSVAVASAMPAIAAAVRVAAADSGSGASNERLTFRVIVRAEARPVGFALPQIGDGQGLVPATHSLQSVSIARSAVALHGRDAGFRQRGFNARAPPIAFA